MRRRSPQQGLRDATMALRALQENEVTRVMGYPSTPEQIRRRGDSARESMHRLADDVEYLAQLVEMRNAQVRAEAVMQPNRRARRSR